MWTQDTHAPTLLHTSACNNKIRKPIYAVAKNAAEIHEAREVVNLLVADRWRVVKSVGVLTVCGALNCSWTLRQVYGIALIFLLPAKVVSYLCYLCRCCYAAAVARMNEESV